MKKTILRIAIPVVLICLFVFPFAYSAKSPAPPEKIFFVMAPRATVNYCLVDDVEDCVVVLIAVVISSTYGPFTVFLVEEQTLATDGMYHQVDHWYTNKPSVVEKYNTLITNRDVAWGVTDHYDVTHASIVVTSSSEDQLSVTVSVKKNLLFTAQYTADTSQDTEPKLIRIPSVPQEQFLAVTARRDVLVSETSVTGIDLGDHIFSDGYFNYARTELFDPSLLS